MTSSRWPQLTRVLNVLIWAGLIAVVAYRMWPQVAAAFGMGATGPQVPDIQVETLAGEHFTLSGLRGQVVLVNFWATWCPPCRVEMPGFQDVYEARKADGFVILGLATDRAPRGTVGTFLRERGITYPVAMATAEAVRAFGGARALPTSILIDAQGRIRHEVTGIFAEPALREAVDRLLAERNAELTSEVR